MRQEIGPTQLAYFVKTQDRSYPLRTVCEVLGLQRSSYYFCTSPREAGRLQHENKQLEQEVKRVYHAQKGIYGAPKIYAELKRTNALPFAYSLKRIQRIMRRLGLRSVVLKKYRPFRSDRKIYQGGQDLLKRDFHSSRRNEKWVSDITYVHTSRNGWCYLASIMDLATNKIVGWHFSKTMDKECVLQALDHAIATQKPAKGCILHSDRGSQYTSNKYRHTVNTNGFKQSFSAKGCPYDNAPIESFHAIFKKEFVYLTTLHSYEDAIEFLNLLRAVIIEIVFTVGLVTKPLNKWRISSIHT
ncbi:IS3 family transposase [Baia soyae]|uniref:IS3 family transposase n=1 Tax=Baia soyae TaxID=1544746 RepID=UPI001FB1EE51|nr:IS3 family transposase [Baia soyae]